MTTQSYTVASNKGRSRIWLEGKRLIGSGFVRGSQYNRSVVRDEDDTTIFLALDNDGRYKTSGKGDRPILDICGLFNTGDKVFIHYGNNLITITK